MGKWIHWESQPIRASLCTFFLPLFPSSFLHVPLPHPLPPAITSASQGPLTLRVVPGVKFKQPGIVREGTHRCGSSARSRFCGHHTTQDGHERGQGTHMQDEPSRLLGDFLHSPPQSHLQAHLSWRMRTAQHWLGEGELQHQLVLGVLALRASSQISTAWQVGVLSGPTCRVRGSPGDLQDLPLLPMGPQPTCLTFC